MRGLIFHKANNVLDVYNIIFENIDRLSFSQHETLHQHFQGLSGLDEEKQKPFMQFVHYVDREYSPYGSNRFLRHKMSIILSAATYYCSFYDRILNYTNGELSLLAKYSSIEPIDSYSEMLVRFPQNVLSLINSKTSDILSKDDVLFWYDYYLSSEDVREYLENKLRMEDVDKLILESSQIQKKIIKEMESDDSRRI